MPGLLAARDRQGQLVARARLDQLQPSRGRPEQREVQVQRGRLVRLVRLVELAQRDQRGPHQPFQGQRVRRATMALTVTTVR